MTAEIVGQAQRRLDLGRPRHEVAEESDLQYETPGARGKLMGLDRIPEVCCLGKRLSQLSEDEAPQQWAAVLSQRWMEQNPDDWHSRCDTPLMNRNRQYSPILPKERRGVVRHGASFHEPIAKPWRLHE
ncbi:MAG TPA: hypothetical protein PLL20_07455 [Phycisphaerae bacterium]|jgi:hypothetical protein|nr:hypothetical protein [Phycisphaerae bacterium]HRR84780.1 hypothetical protein [Phycisphaerae bacterium]